MAPFQLMSPCVSFSLFSSMLGVCIIPFDFTFSSLEGTPTLLFKMYPALYWLISIGSNKIYPSHGLMCASFHMTSTLACTHCKSVSHLLLMLLDLFPTLNKSPSPLGSMQSRLGGISMQSTTCFICKPIYICTNTCCN